MATDKKHIAVYLAPEIEQALIAFCEQKGLKSKKGTMFSAGVNAALAEFFGVAGTKEGNIPCREDNIPVESSNIPVRVNGNILSTVDNIPLSGGSNIPNGSSTVEALPGKFRA